MEGHNSNFIATEGRMLVLHTLHNRFEIFKKVLHELPQNEGNNSHFWLSKNAVLNETCGKKTW